MQFSAFPTNREAISQMLQNESQQGQSVELVRVSDVGDHRNRGRVRQGVACGDRLTGIVSGAAGGGTLAATALPDKGKGKFRVLSAYYINEKQRSYGEEVLYQVGDARGEHNQNTIYSITKRIQALFSIPTKT